ncbi:MAG: hypothetical protein ACLPYB_06925 [Desulfobaccales bacterium]
MEAKEEPLKDNVVALVIEFLKTAGGISLEDLEDLFGLRRLHEAAIAIHRKTLVKFTLYGGLPLQNKPKRL